MIDVEFHLNGEPVRLRCPADRRLLDILREDFGLTAAKPGCAIGRCSACMIWLDDAPANACLLLALRVNGRSVRTYEAVCQDPASQPVRDALAECGGLQCGYCTPGMVMTLSHLHQLPAPPHAPAARELASANLCRCTGYGGIRRAIDRLFEPAEGSAATPIRTCGDPA